MNQSAAGLLWLSSLESLVAMIFIIVSSFLVIVITKKYSLNKATAAAFIFGIIGGVIFLLFWETQGSLPDPEILTINGSPVFDLEGNVIMTSDAIEVGGKLVYQVGVNNSGNILYLSNTPFNNNEVIGTIDYTSNINDAYLATEQFNPWFEEVNNWLNFFPVIFLNLLQLAVVPLVFITIIWLVTVKSKESNMSSKSFAQSVGFLALMEIIGIAIAFALIPLLSFVEFDQSIFGSTSFDPETGESIESFTSFWDIIIGWFPNNWSSLMAGTSVMITVVFIAWVIGISLRKMDSKGNEAASDLVRFFELFYEMFKTFIKWILYLVPFTVFSKMPSLMYGNAANSWASLGILIGIVFLGLLIAITIHFIIITLLSNPKTSLRFLNNIKSSWLTSLLTRSSIASMPQHSDALINSGVNDDVANTVPTLGTSMGLSMCAGMYPAMISIITLQSTAAPDTNMAISYLLIFFIIFLTSFGVAGVPGAFDATAVSALSSAGLSTSLVPVVLVLEPILDPFRTIVNTTGSSASSFIMNKIHTNEKHNNSPADEITFEHIDPSTIDEEEYQIDHIIKDEKEIIDKIEKENKNFINLSNIKTNKKIKVKYSPKLKREQKQKKDSKKN